MPTRSSADCSFRRHVWWLTGVLLVGLLAGCSFPRAVAPSTGAPSAAAIPDAAAVPPTGTVLTPSGTPREKEWAQRALQILGTVDAAVQDYHQATAEPPGSARRRLLQDSAYIGFRKAVAEHDALWPVTQEIGDTGARDQFIFVLGNISGFLNPTPDLPGDLPTLGDRVARSLQNAIATGASLRPRLERLAAQR